MNSKQIECLLEVNRTGNFNQAAENLYITQPTLSYHIKALEDSVGFKIFERASGRAAKLTPAGKSFIKDLTSIWQNWIESVERGQNISENYSGSLHIALPALSFLPELPKAIKGFSNIYPEIFIETTYDSSPRAFEGYVNGEFDLLFQIKSSYKKPADSLQTKLFDSHFFLVVPTDHPLANKKLVGAKDLKGQTLMVGDVSPKELKLLQEEAKAKSHLLTLNTSNHETTLTNILSGRGVCIIPDLFLEHRDDLVWIPYETDLVMPCVVTYPTNASEELKAFVALLSELCLHHPRC